MDYFLDSGFGALLFLVGSLAMAAPFAVFSSTWRRPSPQLPYLVDAPDEAAVGPEGGTAPPTATDGPTCAVCLEELGRDGPEQAAFSVTAHAVYAVEESCRSGGGHFGGHRRDRNVAAPPRRVALCCGHVFHGGCIYRWVALCPTTPSCPVCKTPIGAPLWEVVVK